MLGTGLLIQSELTFQAFTSELHLKEIPSHIGIRGNEIADSLAEVASLETPQFDIFCTHSEVFFECQKHIFLMLPHYMIGTGGFDLMAPFFCEGNRSQQTCISHCQWIFNEYLVCTGGGFQDLNQVQSCSDIARSYLKLSWFYFGQGVLGTSSHFGFFGD